MDLTASLRDLFRQMSETQEGFPPLMFLNALRAAFPQFAQKAKDGHGYAQQDAEEAWSQIVSQLRQKLKIKDTIEGSTADPPKEVSFVDKYISGTFESKMQCDESAAVDAGEEPISSTDSFFKLNCHINAETNHLRDGLAAGLKEQIEKRSSTLDRDAVYTKSSEIARLPKYLPVHFMRFDWRRTTNKKAKIMRKVTFPHELDVVEFCTEELKSKLIPIRDKIRDIQKDEEDISRARKRQKRIQQGEDFETEQETKAKAAASKESEKKSQKEKEKKKGGKSGDDTEMEDVEYKTDAQVEAEKVEAVIKAKKELLSLVNPELGADISANQTGLYELRGVITHQGATADSGHYTAFVKKIGRKDVTTGKRKEEDGKWWWFNDDKVSEVESDRIETLSGGGKYETQVPEEIDANVKAGQSHSALILLYRAVPLPRVDE